MKIKLKSFKESALEGLEVTKEIDLLQSQIAQLEDYKSRNYYDAQEVRETDQEIRELEAKVNELQSTLKDPVEEVTTTSDMSLELVDTTEYDKSHKEDDRISINKNIKSKIGDNNQ